MNARTPSLAAAAYGALAGIVASVIQVTVGWLLDKLLLPPGQHNNIAPRFVKRLFQWQGKPAHPVRDWILGTLFHVGYGLGWGAAFGIARRSTGIPSPLLGGLTGLAIYLLAFSGKGVGTQTGTEPHPRRRSWRKQLSLVAVAWTYAMCTALVYDRLTEPAPSDEDEVVEGRPTPGTQA